MRRSIYMRINFQFLFIPAFLILLSSCTQEEFNLRTCSSPTMDGHTYEVVRIGEQCWFAENLKTTEFSDGTPIPMVAPSALADMKVPGRVVDSNLPDHYNTFYNGWTLLTPKGICPEGWKVPTANDYTDLHRYTRSVSNALHSNVEGFEFCDPHRLEFFGHRRGVQQIWIQCPACRHHRYGPRCVHIAFRTRGLFLDPPRPVVARKHRQNATRFHRREPLS